MSDDKYTVGSIRSLSERGEIDDVIRGALDPCGITAKEIQRLRAQLKAKERELGDTKRDISTALELMEAEFYEEAEELLIKHKEAHQ